MSEYIDQGEIARRNDLARHHLLRSGIRLRDLPAGRSPEWETESGHTMDVALHPQTGEWTMGATHYGDPTGNALRSMLGTHDESEIPGRLSAELRHRETTGHLRDMWLRASGNNDPTGRDEEAQRVPRYMAANPQTIFLDHYQGR
jgi:hypothetical protein